MMKLIAIDMDGTALNDKKVIGDANKKALKEAMEKGVQVVIASGRGYSTLPKEALSMEGIEYAIAGNGSTIYRISDGSCICRHTLKEKAVLEILKLTENEDVVYEAFIEGIPYTSSYYHENAAEFGADDWAVSYIQSTRRVVPDIKAFIEEHIHELDSIDVIAKEISVQKRLIKVLREQVSEVFCTSSVPRIIEISDKNSGKGKALKQLAEMLDIKREEIVAFGDAENDLEMIEYAGCGIAMGNATDHLKRCADFITKTNNEDGVAWALEQYFYIIQEENQHEIVRTLLDIGEWMLISCAEIHRVEETMMRMAKAFGSLETNVFVITSSIVITVRFAGGKEVTMTRRIVNQGDTNFEKVEELNELSRASCQNRVRALELRERAAEIIAKPKSWKQIYVGSVIGAFSFSVFFGGSVLDGLLSALMAAFICVLQKYFSPFCLDRLTFNLFGSLIVGLGICVIGKVVPGVHVDKIMIGDIMLLIPGLALTNSIRDILLADTLAGTLRMIETLLWAGALALGFMGAILLSNFLF